MTKNTRNELMHLSKKFISRIKLKNKIRLHPFCFQTWYRGAYSTFQRTHPRKHLKKFDSQQMILNISQEFKVLPCLPASLRSYEDWFAKVTSRFSNKTGFSFGAAQKLINILIKYHFCYFYSGQDPAWNKRNKWVSKLFRFFHIPVDRVVMVTSKKKKFKKLLLFNFIAVRHASWNGKLIKTPSFIVAGKRVPWSKLKDQNVYELFQRELHCLAMQYKRCCPLHLEMKDLWV